MQRYESLTAAAYAPGASTSFGTTDSPHYRVELIPHEGPELHHEPLGEIATEGNTFAEAVRRMLALLAKLGYEGELIVADETHGTTYTVSHLVKGEHTTKVYHHAVERDFPHTPFPAPHTLSRNVIDEAGGVSDTAILNHVNAPNTTPPPEEPPTTEGRLRFDQNPTGQRFVFYRHHQDRADVDRMAEWMEQQHGVTTHLASNLLLDGVYSIMHADTTYDEVKSMMYDPNSDISEFIVGDSENGIDLLVQVKQVPRT